MGKQRIEAFSDGVIAIIITIMVLELRAPEGASFEALRPLVPTFLSYVLSFVYVGIYWNNHHHMLRAARTISGTVMWANMHQLFWLSMVPFATAWMGEHYDRAAPVAAYGGVLVMNAIAYTTLSRLLIRHDGPDSPLAEAMGGVGRRQGPAVAGGLSDRGGDGLRGPAGVAGDLRPGGGGVVHPRPAGGAGAFAHRKLNRRGGPGISTPWTA